MLWMVAILLALTYAAVLGIVLLFFSSTARRNRLSDEATEALWKSRFRTDEERAS